LWPAQPTFDQPENVGGNGVRSGRLWQRLLGLGLGLGRTVVEGVEFDEDVDAVVVLRHCQRPGMISSVRVPRTTSRPM
jgi:hypothetical protein